MKKIKQQNQKKWKKRKRIRILQIYGLSDLKKGKSFKIRNFFITILPNFIMKSNFKSKNKDTSETKKPKKLKVPDDDFTDLWSFRSKKRQKF